MPPTNPTLPTFQQNRPAATFLQVLGEPTRLNIVRLLANGPSNVTDLSTALQVEIVNTSHHLGVLKSAGVVQDRKDGRFVIYSLAGECSVSGNRLTLSGSGVTVMFDKS